VAGPVREQPEVGTEVTVAWGKYGGRSGRVVRYDRVERGGGNDMIYPVVMLDATARARPLVARVTSVTVEHRTAIHPSGRVACACGVTSPRFGTNTNAVRWIRSHYEEVGVWATN
jgi:hypothetical protein